MKVGVFGGTFNPIHTGHAIIASYVVQHCGLDKLWMMVSPLNPFKEAQGEQLDVERLRMVEMVSSRLDNVETSGFEFSLPRPSYTIDTLNALQAKFPQHEFYLIIGADNWASFDKWNRHEEILAKYKVLVYPRSGFEIGLPDCSRFQNVAMIEAPIIELSSTEIRKGIKMQRNMAYYLPDDVYRYILKNKLYV